LFDLIDYHQNSREMEKRLLSHYYYALNDFYHISSAAANGQVIYISLAESGRSRDVIVVFLVLLSICLLVWL